jgi:hypothetical protein
MLFADQPNWHDAPGRDGNCGAVQTFQHHDSLCVMAERSVPEISRDHFAFNVEPVVQEQKIFHGPAPFFHGREGVMVRVGHFRLLKIRG